MVLNVDNKTFIVHVAALAESTTIPIYPSYQAQVALQISKETEILVEYSNFSNVFSSNSAAELPEHIGINNHSINLLDNKQPLYSLIYSLGPVELEILKTYIKANLTSGFIRPSKSPADGLIPFIQKTNISLPLCVDYQGLNNLTIKDCYALPLIGESFNCLGCTKHFTQLNLTNTYHQMRIRKGDK